MTQLHCPSVLVSVKWGQAPVTVWPETAGAQTGVQGELKEGAVTQGWQGGKGDHSAWPEGQGAPPSLERGTLGEATSLEPRPSVGRGCQAPVSPTPDSRVVWGSSSHRPCTQHRVEPTAQRSAQSSWENSESVTELSPDEGGARQTAQTRHCCTG